MDNENRNNTPDSDKRNNTPDSDATGEVMSWVITFILMIAFWPLGLFLLLRKLNVFGGSSKKSGKQKNDRANEWTYETQRGRRDDNARYAQAQYKEAARNAEAAAREVASGIARSAREAGQVARQAIEEVYADLSREFSQYKSPKSQATHSQASQTAQTAQTAQATQTAQARGQADAPQTQTQTHSRQSQQTQSQTAHSQTQTQTSVSQTPKPQDSQTRSAQAAQSQAQAARSVFPAQTNDSWAAGQNFGASKQKKKKERAAIEKKSGRAVSLILLIISIVLFILGANTIAGAARGIWVNDINAWPDLILGAFYFIGGLISFLARGISARRLARYKRIYVYVFERDAVPIRDIARATGLSERAAKRDVMAMIGANYLGRDAYLDSRLDSLILTAKGSDEARHTSKGATDESGAPLSGETQNPYMAIIMELREINNSIADISISDKVERIEILTGKIFRAVEEDPGKLPQIRRFMSYYLPTTQKLLRSYATLEKQGISGENITSTKESIERILDSLTSGFEQQLDQLFSSDAIDIASDINVLENLMQQDGLAGDKSELKTMEGV